MSAIIPFDFASNVPAVNLARKREGTKNSLLMTTSGPSFPVLSIKGKVFTLVKDGERKMLTRKVKYDDGTEDTVPMAALSLAVVAGNARARVFYDKGYTEGESDGQKPACFSFDGVAPDATADSPQATKCQICPHAKWGSKVGTSNSGEAKGTACAPRTRLAVTDPNAPAIPFLLDLPPASRGNLSDEIKVIDAHGKEFTEVAFRVSFDAEAPTPKLVFKAVGMLSDDALAKLKELAENPVVADIIGTPTEGAPAEAPKAEAPKPPAKAETPRIEAPKAETPKPRTVVSDDEMDGVLSGAAAAETKAVVQRAAAKPKAEKKVEKPEPPKAVASSGDSGLNELVGGLSDLLNATDD